MSLYRAAWQKIGPLARKTAHGLCRNVIPRRQMSSSVPGGSGENIVYALLCTGALASSVSYTYVTVTADHARYNARVAEIRGRPKAEWKPGPWPPRRDDEDDVDEE